jgi:hypothetical protein
MHTFPNLLHSAISLPNGKGIILKAVQGLGLAVLCFFIFCPVLKACEVILAITEEVLLQLGQDPEYSWAIFRLEFP